MAQILWLSQDLHSLERELDIARRGHANAERILVLERQIAAVRHAQDELLRRFVEDHAARLRELAYRMVGRDHADDVAESAFVDLIWRFGLKPLPEVARLLETPQELFKLICRVTCF